MKPVNLLLVSAMLSASYGSAVAKADSSDLNANTAKTIVDSSSNDNKVETKNIKATNNSKPILNTTDTKPTSIPTNQPNIEKILSELNKQHNNASSLVKSARKPVSLSLNSPLLINSSNKTSSDNVLERLTAVASNTVDKFKQSGVASWYGRQFHGKQTASGEIFDMNAMTAAHKSLQFGCYVKVTNKDNGKTVVVKINDRGPFKGNRVLDLSKAAAEKIGLTDKGVGNVTIERVATPN